MNLRALIIQCGIIQCGIVATLAAGSPIGAQESTAGDSGPANGAVEESATGEPLKAPFDLEQRADEHPLMPAIRLMKQVLAHIDQNVHDYSCTLYKRERIDGELGEAQHIFVKVRHQPFSVYMSFLKPFQGREVLYVAGENDGKLLALECGLKRKLGTLRLHPEGRLAMNGQKHPITKLGIRNLTHELLITAEQETRYGECEVSSNPNTKIDGRPATMIQVTHPIPRREFSAHVTRVFVDNELCLPIHYDSHMWPNREGGEPLLEEAYTYRNLQINLGLDSRDFDTDNPEIFQP
jgi:hypothetical protein